MPSETALTRIGRLPLLGWPRRIGLGALATLLCSPCLAEWALNVGRHERALTEFDASGQRLVSERGSIARVGAQWQGDPGASAPGGRWHLQVDWSQGQLRYVGQTQTGEPAQSRTRHREGSAQIRWRAWPGETDDSTGGSWWVGVHATDRWREIADVALATGLSERSQEISPLVRWQSPRLSWCQEAGDHPCLSHIALQVQRSRQARLSVDFHGLLDSARFGGGARRDLRLTLAGQWGPNWRWGVDLARTDQAASRAVTATLDGAPVGQLMQPRLRVLERGVWLERQLR